MEIRGAWMPQHAPVAHEIDFLKFSAPRAILQSHPWILHVTMTNIFHMGNVNLRIKLICFVYPILEIN